MSYQLVIWLEIHCKLKSQTWLFCACPNQQDFDTLKANTHICPVCTAQPGGLPVLQAEPVELAVKLAHCLWALIHPVSRFDRKSYFYPDLPNGYQITQLYQPYCSDGVLEFYTDHYRTHNRIGIKEAHLEIDTGKTVHVQQMWLIDFNRSGTPLVEIVTNPDFRSADQVIEFLKELQRILRYNQISDADLEKWHMRCDVNLSIMPWWSSEYGTRVELKNINSYSNIRAAIQYEYDRQVQMLNSQQVISQETRWRDANQSNTYSLRSKETLNDYLYFPDPDLPPLCIDQTYIDHIRSLVCELPSMSIARMMQDYGFHKEYINTLISDKKILDYVHNIIAQGYDPKTVAKWVCGPVCARLNSYDTTIDFLKYDMQQFTTFLDMIDSYNIQDTQAKMVIEQLLDTGEPVDTIVHHLWLDQVVDIDYASLCQEVITQHSKVVADYQGGKLTAISFLVWQVMKLAGGKADPNQAKKFFESKLSS